MGRLTERAVVSTAALGIAVAPSASWGQSTTTYSYNALGRVVTANVNGGTSSTYRLDAAAIVRRFSLLQLGLLLLR